MADHELLEQFEEWLDEFGPVKIGDLEYEASDVLREVDPITYRIWFWEWAETMGYTDEELGDVHLYLP